MLSWTVIVDVVVITALAAGAVERFAGAHPPHCVGPLIRPRTAIPFDQHTAKGLKSTEICQTTWQIVRSL